MLRFVLPSALSDRPEERPEIEGLSPRICLPILLGDLLFFPTF